MKIRVILGFLTLIVLFQNFTLSNLYDKKYLIDEKSRQQHAKEILGTKYKKSAAKNLEGEKFLHVYLFNLVEKKLPKKYKNKSNLITRTLINEAKKHEVDPIFLTSLIMTESSFNPEAKGTSGEIGLMQLMPATAESVAKQMGFKWNSKKTLLDPVKNIKIGTNYISQLRGFFDNNPNRYISAYNSGPGKIMKIEDKNNLPKLYSSKVLKYYVELYKKLSQTKVPDNIAYN